MNLQNRETHRLKKTNLWLPGGGMEARDSWRVGDGHVHTAVFKVGNQQGPTV